MCAVRRECRTLDISADIGYNLAMVAREPLAPKGATRSYCSDWEQEE